MQPTNLFLKYFGLGLLFALFTALTLPLEICWRLNKNWLTVYHKEIAVPSPAFNSPETYLSGRSCRKCNEMVDGVWNSESFPWNYRFIWGAWYRLRGLQKHYSIFSGCQVDWETFKRPFTSHQSYQASSKWLNDCFGSKGYFWHCYGALFMNYR